MLGDSQDAAKKENQEAIRQANEAADRAQWEKYLAAKKAVDADLEEAERVVDETMERMLVELSNFSGETITDLAGNTVAIPLEFSFRQRIAAQQLLKTMAPKVATVIVNGGTESIADPETAAYVADAYSKLWRIGYQSPDNRIDPTDSDLISRVVPLDLNKARGNADYAWFFEETEVIKAMLPFFVLAAPIIKARAKEMIAAMRQNCQTTFQALKPAASVQA